MGSFVKNIGRTGRIIRGIGAVALLVGGFLVWGTSPVAGAALMLCGGFVAFEAARGWCVLRACGLKTKF